MRMVQGNGVVEGGVMGLTAFGGRCLMVNDKKASL
jgi:hypothetical protein